MSKSNKSAKQKATSKNQVAQPVVDTEKDLSKKEPINLTKNKSRLINPSDLDVKNQLKQPPPSINLTDNPSNLEEEQNKEDTGIVLINNPTCRDLLALRAG